MSRGSKGGAFADLGEGLASLFARRYFGIKFSLDSIHRLCEILGHPERNLRFIHVSGTNGKGSVCAMAAAILQESGLRTGLYTSPHLIRYHERFRMDGEEISDSELTTQLDRVMKVAKDATFFEISTALAFCWFRDRKAEVVVLETGMGGRLDATNCITPEVSVITSIGMDHQGFLGETLEKIAMEKAGILKTGVPAWTSPQKANVMEVLRHEAWSRSVPLDVITEAQRMAFDPPLIGEHQRDNMALAVEAVRQVSPGISREMIQHGLARTNWLARCQILERKDGLPPVLVDGAHNLDGVQVLSREIERHWGRGKVTLIFGVLVDKSIPEMARELQDVVAEVLLTSVPSERSADPAILSQYFSKSQRFSSLAEAWAEADRKGRPIVIAGSLFLAGEALRLQSESRAKRHPNELTGKIASNSDRRF